MLHVQRRERPCISTNQINHCFLSPLEITQLTASWRATVKFSARVGGRNVKYLNRVKERGEREGESYPLISLSLSSLALNDEAPRHQQNRHTHTHILTHISTTLRVRMQSELCSTVVELFILNVPYPAHALL